MPSHWAVLSSVLVAIQPVAASYIPESPNSVEPTNAAIASSYLLGVSPRITDAPLPEPHSLAGRADAFDRNTDTCGFYSDGAWKSLDAFFFGSLLSMVPLFFLVISCFVLKKRRGNRCGAFALISYPTYDLTMNRLPPPVLCNDGDVRVRIQVCSLLQTRHHLQHLFHRLLRIHRCLERELLLGEAQDGASDGLLVSLAPSRTAKPGRRGNGRRLTCTFSYDRSTPNCVLHTLLVSSTTLGVWGCATTLTGETLYTTNPFLKTTSDSTSSSRPRSSSTAKSTSTSTTTTTTPASESSTSTSTSSAADTSSASSGGKKSNTGAIVGGAVGGVGALAIIGAAIFFFMRGRKKNSVDSSPNAAAAAQPMLHHPQQSPPPPGQASPYGYHHPQGGSPVYDPNMAYQHHQGGGSPQPYPPPSQSPYDPRQSGYAGWGAQQPAPGSTSPAAPSHAASGLHHGPAVELSDSRAVGTGGNRAELG